MKRRRPSAPNCSRRSLRSINSSRASAIARNVARRCEKARHSRQYDLACAINVETHDRLARNQGLGQHTRQSFAQARVYYDIHGPKIFRNPLRRD